MNKDLPIVEWLRGFAALAVCLFHFADGNINFPGSTIWFKEIASFGWLGVEVFFVISGFIIPYALYRSGYNFTMFPRFLLRRCLRIEPAYIVSVLVVISLGYLSMLIPGYSGKDYNPTVAGSLLHIIYAPVYFGYNWLLPIYWTLEAELHFYILIGILFPVLNRNLAGLLLTSGILLTLSFLIPLFVFYYMALFIMGISSYSYLVKKIPATLFFIIIMVSAYCIYRSSGSIAIPITGLFPSLILAYAGKFKVKPSLLGKISFSLYLIHIPIGGRLINFLGRYDDSAWIVWLGLLATTILTLFAAWLFYRLIEYPAIAFSKKIRYTDCEKSTDNIPALSPG